VQYAIDVDVLCFAYVAVDMNTGGVFELDVLNSTLPNARAFDSFAELAQAGSRVGHPRANRLVDSGWHQDTPFVVTGEIADCETVALYLTRRRRTIPPAEALRIVADVLEVVDAAHQQNVVHGWLEPRAILLLDNGSVVVRGFGLSELRSQAATQFGLPLAPNSVIFKSPEQLQGGTTDHYADLWAAAALLFVLLSGRSLYPGADDQEIYRAAMLAHRRRLDQVEPKAPEELVNVLERALASEPSNRFDSAKDFALKLQQLAELPLIRSRRHLADEPLQSKEASRQRPPEPAARPPSVRPPPPATVRPAGRFSGAYSQVTPSARPINVPNLARVATPPRGSQSSSEQRAEPTTRDKPNRKA
jgi:serine/threonine-protein kinase